MHKSLRKARINRGVRAEERGAASGEQQFARELEQFVALCGEPGRALAVAGHQVVREDGRPDRLAKRQAGASGGKVLPSRAVGSGGKVLPSRI